jgi:hypothetical protein
VSDVADWVAGIGGAIGAATGITALIRTWNAPTYAKESVQVAQGAKSAVDATNGIAREAKTVAEKANELAEAANRISTESVGVAHKSKEVADAANGLAVQANALAERANQLASDSNGIAGEALQVSRESAVSARESARAAEETAKLERDARHDLYGPVPPAAIRTWLQAATHVGVTLFGEITVGRDYQMSAIGRYATNSAYDIAHGRLVRANVPIRFALETWPPDRREPATAEIEFRFWPAVRRSDVDGWVCPCDKEAEHPEGHWRFVVPIAPPPPRRVDAEWHAHLVDYPDHQREETVVPHGWVCHGTDDEPCTVKSSSLN